MSRFVLRPVATTAFPAARAALAKSTPIPRPAPVTIQTCLSVSGIDILLYGWMLHARQYHPRYSPECVEGEFCELRLLGILGNSTRISCIIHRLWLVCVYCATNRAGLPLGCRPYAERRFLTLTVGK